jgi:hypothetical protein
MRAKKISRSLQRKLDSAQQLQKETEQLHVLVTELTLLVQTLNEFVTELSGVRPENTPRLLRWTVLKN